MANEKRLIDANVLMDKIKENGNPYGLQNVTPTDVYAFAIASVETAPTVDAVEVVHGRWEDSGKNIHGQDLKRCSLCESISIEGGLFCRTCGADMRGKWNA